MYIFYGWLLNQFELLNGNYSKFIFIGAMLVGLSMMIWYFNVYLKNKNHFVLALALIVGILSILAIRAVFMG